MASLRVYGAREHNLQSVDLELPRDQLIVFCGVSGSGKSSLAFDTLFVEGRRRYIEALALQALGLDLAPPDVDQIDGLPPTAGLAQRQGVLGPRSTLGSTAQLDPLLRVLFGRAGVLHCPRCGRPVTPTTHDEIVAELLALPRDTRLNLEAPVSLGEEPVLVLDEIRRAGFSRVRVGEEVLTIEELKLPQLRGVDRLRIVVDRIRIEPDRRARLHDSVRLGSRAGHGVLVASYDGQERTFVDRPICVHDDLLLPALEPRLLSHLGPPGACPTCEGSRAVDGMTCPSCQGERLSEVARAVRWRGLSFRELQRTPVSALGQRLVVSEPDPVEAATLPELQRRLEHLVALGLGHRAPGQAMDTLSGSEIQRSRLVRQVAAPLSGVLYVLDEPTAGLDAAATATVVRLMRELVAAGNTVLAVEHAEQVLRAADHLVEFGPGAGVMGGRIVYQGGLSGLLAADTPTSRWLSGKETIGPRQVQPQGEVEVRGPWNGQSPPVRLPRQVVVALTGPAASGKSRLIGLLGAALTGAGLPPGVELVGAEGLSRTVLADRGAARAVRSSPATYIGLWDTVRELLASSKDASVRGLTPATFSLATAGGRCEACKGTGERRVELGPLPEVISRCPVCDGRRFQQDVLEVRWKGLNAAELLDMSAEQARVVLAGHPRLEEGLRAMMRVGLGYVPLGQPVQTLSGGEARRLVLARELTRAHRRGAEDTVYLLDEPTVGLHPQDTRLLVGLLRELADEGATVWAATVDPILVGAADRVTSLPPAPWG
jgi:excinuclease ABC subunit A